MAVCRQFLLTKQPKPARNRHCRQFAPRKVTLTLGQFVVECVAKKGQFVTTSEIMLEVHVTLNIYNYYV